MVSGNGDSGPEEEAKEEATAIDFEGGDFGRPPSSSSARLEIMRQRERLKIAMFNETRDLILNRYKPVRKLGQGGMGVVDLVFDRRLEREVALKRVYGGRDLRLREYLLAEARGMAKLRHPNIVPVFDLHEVDGVAIIAMEYVKGQTLREWSRAQIRSTEELAQAFLQAGEGLAAAHEQGLVHLDFKPDNVMVGDDGRVRVMDFGLVRPDSDQLSTRSFEPARDAKGVCERVALAGTPAYMAPERVRERWSGAASDQFSFCVAFYELLYGQRPFAGATHEQVWDAMARGEVRSPPAGATAPTWLREIVVRGLASNSSQRFPSMRALLDTLCARLELEVGASQIDSTLGLGPQPQSRRLRHGLLAVSSLLVLAVVAIGLWRGSERRAVDRVAQREDEHSAASNSEMFSTTSPGSSVELAAAVESEASEASTPGWQRPVLERSKSESETKLQPKPERAAAVVSDSSPEVVEPQTTTRASWTVVGVAERKVVNLEGPPLPASGLLVLAESVDDGRVFVGAVRCRIVHTQPARCMFVATAQNPSLRVGDKLELVEI